MVHVTGTVRRRPLAERATEELRGRGPHRPRAMVEVRRPNQDDIPGVEGTSAPAPR